MFSFVAVAFVALVLGLSYMWVQWKYSYFRVRNIPHQSPKFPLGNILDLSAPESSLAAWIKRAYFQYRDQHPLGGFFLGLEPAIMLHDLEAIKSVLITNFSSFTDHTFYINESNDPLSAVLFSMSGEKWRNMRTKLSPTFSNYNTKNMFSAVESIGENMLDFLEENYVTKNQPFNAKNLTMRFICDSIGSCGFGLDCGALAQSDPYLLQLADQMLPYNRPNVAYWFLTGVYDKMARFLRLRIMPKSLTEYFRQIVLETVRYRQENNVTRKDFLNLLIEIKNKGCLTEDESGEELGKISYVELQAQAFLIFFAGFQTSRVTLSFALFELAVNLNVQAKLREEIQNKLTPEGKLTYDTLTEMPYLDQVVNETLRKYPPQSCLTRVATADCQIPGTHHVVTKGTHIYIPIIGIQNDPEIYPDPERFDPERMTSDKMKDRHPCSFMPFGMGPRICIGQRFGQLQVKLGIAMILMKYRLTINSRTRQPLDFLPSRIDLDVHEGIWINAAAL